MKTGPQHHFALQSEEPARALADVDVLPKEQALVLVVAERERRLPGERCRLRNRNNATVEHRKFQCGQTFGAKSDRAE